MSWADSTAGGRGPSIVADSTARGRWPSVVGGLRCRREMAECRGRTLLPPAGGRGPNIWLPGGEPSVVGEEIDGQG